MRTIARVAWTTARCLTEFSLISTPIPIPPRKPAELSVRLRELAWLFLKLGSTSFGGPAAHIAMMEDEVVARRGWLSRDEFLDYVGATNLIPGPNSTELAIHIGRARAGWPGLLVAGACFILPASLIVASIAWGYVRFGALPAVAGLLYGVKPVVIAVVMQALWRLMISAVKSTRLAVLAFLAALLAAAGVNELIVLFGTGAAAALARDRSHPPASSVLGMSPATAYAGVAPATAVVVAASAATPFGLWPLFGVFVKIGSVLFGSGYVLVAFLRTDLVQRSHWLTEQQLLDAVAVGQVTPGPVFTTATFIGYLLGGSTGAMVATIGIFLPAFIFVAVSGVLIPWMRRSAVMGDVLDGVNVASLALMAVVTAILAQAAWVDATTVAFTIIAAILLLRFRVNSAWLVIGSAAAGLGVQRFLYSVL